MLSSVNVYVTLPVLGVSSVAVNVDEPPTTTFSGLAVRLTDFATGVDSNSYFSVPCPLPGVQVNLYLPLVLGVNVIL
ncbi:unknown [Eubacterium sp. CAG:581]|nr:unknown [Eubacterium sp. CAG:581]